MSSKKSDTDKALRLLPRPEAPKPPPAAAPATAEAYAFPTKSRCPRCKSINTKRRGDSGITQYRVCEAPVCGHKYSVLGTRV